MVILQASPSHTTPFPGVELFTLPDSRFKRAILEVHFDRSLADASSPARSLLGRILEQGTVSCPSQMELTRQEESFWGGRIGFDGNRLADAHRMTLSSSWVGADYLPEGESAQEGILSLAQELLEDPFPDSSGSPFQEAAFQRERAQLALRIRTLKDDKAAWAQERYLQFLCEGENYGKPPWGSEEEILSLTPDDVNNARLDLLRNAPITAIAVGPVEADSIGNWLRDWFKGEKREQRPSKQAIPVPNELREVREHMPMDQARFLMGFRYPEISHPKDMEALGLAVSLLGGGTHSRLFRIVREEKSLCYGISSGVRLRKGILTVGAGIDSQAYEEVRDEVLRQVQVLVEGGFSDKELEDSRAGLLHDLDTLGDSAAGLARHSAREALFGLNRSPFERSELIQALTKEDVATAAEQWKPSLVYLLEGGAES
ncbi:MAG: pitrilysin family protein [Planctomycetota bacterium]|jgi:predicted Zn-dependent peptidase|nr:pitrilysin family protein [Planctomycetota bacterium]MDP6940495.1 pitrilysin family protein [Planctomycetota bacterium]